MHLRVIIRLELELLPELINACLRYDLIFTIWSSQCHGTTQNDALNALCDSVWGHKLDSW